jgi:AAA domain
MKTKNTENKLLKHFPARLEGDKLLELMAENSNISWAKNEPTSIRKTALQSWQKDWFYVNKYIQPLYDNLYDVLQSTFETRDEKYQIPVLNATREWLENAKVKGYAPPAMKDFHVEGFSIVGVSGVGKTHCTKKILRKCFNQLIDQGNFTQITYLITNCVDVGSLKDLLIKFLSEVDSLLGTSYITDYVNTKNSTEMLQPIVANVGARHSIGVWIIDEVHHLKSVPFRSAEQIMNFLKNISAVIGMPIIYIGTPEVKSILGGNFQIGRRAEGDGSIFWQRYVYDNQNCAGDVSNHPNDKSKCMCFRNNEWKSLLKSLWKRQVLRNVGQLTKAHIDAYYQASKGIMKRLMAVHKRAQIIAMDTDEEQITPEIIHATGEYFQLTAAMIDSLDSRNEHLRAQYPDISMGVFDIIETVSTKRMTEREVVNLVMNGHYTDEEIVMIFNAFVSRLKPVVKDEKKDSPSGAQDKTPKKGTKEKSAPTGDIIEKLSKAKTLEERYQMLKDSGLIGTAETIGAV